MSGRKDTSIHRLLKRVKSFSKYVMKQPDLRKYIQIKEHQHWMYWKKIVILDICGLVLLLGLEVLKMLRYAAQNRLLQKKIYLDEATGLPNKNKCEEILENDKELEAGAQIAVCVFDLNNLRMINNNLGHDKGDAYIRSFAGQLRAAMPEDACRP